MLIEQNKSDLLLEINFDLPIKMVKTSNSSTKKYSITDVVIFLHYNVDFLPCKEYILPLSFHTLTSYSLHTTAYAPSGIPPT